MAKEMSFVGHLEELRWTLIRCVCAVIVCAIPPGILWRRVFDLIAVWPLRFSDPAPALIFTAPTDAVFFVFKIALTCGTILASPFLFLQIWRFVASALHKKEKAAIVPLVIASTLCFLAGVVFSYFFLPFFLAFLVGFAGDLIEPMFRINEYFAFLIRMSISFGLVFEIPVISFALSKMGVIDHRFLLRYLRHAIVAIAILAAILTPSPDVFSQVLMALPLLLFYAVGILIAYLVNRSAKKVSPS